MGRVPCAAAFPRKKEFRMKSKAKAPEWPGPRRISPVLSRAQGGPRRAQGWSPVRQVRAGAARGGRGPPGECTPSRVPAAWPRSLPWQAGVGALEGAREGAQGAAGSQTGSLSHLSPPVSPECSPPRSQALACTPRHV